MGPDLEVIVFCYVKLTWQLIFINFESFLQEHDMEYSKQLLDSITIIQK